MTEDPRLPAARAAYRPEAKSEDLSGEKARQFVLQNFGKAEDCREAEQLAQRGAPLSLIGWP
jgi:hypothetical protein